MLQQWANYQYAYIGTTCGIIAKSNSALVDRHTFGFGGCYSRESDLGHFGQYGVWGK
jgi:hypothetical protein